MLRVSAAPACEPWTLMSTAISAYARGASSSTRARARRTRTRTSGWRMRPSTSAITSAPPTCGRNRRPGVSFPSLVLTLPCCRVQLYKELLKRPTINPDWYLYLGCCYFFLGMYAEADAMAQKAAQSPLQNRLLFHLSHKVCRHFPSSS